MDAEKIFTVEETYTLQEIMNIAFGQSAADLAEVIDTYVVLNVPYLTIMQMTELPHYLSENVQEHKKISVVEQKFRGRFRGDALLIFSSGAGKELMNMLEQDETFGSAYDLVEIVERETLMEVGNILIGACVGRLAELLKDVVTYTPPSVIVETDYNEEVFESRYGMNDTVIVLKTNFTFEKGNVSGLLFLVTNQESISWLKNALRLFIEQYE